MGLARPAGQVGRRAIDLADDDHHPPLAGARGGGHDLGLTAPQSLPGPAERLAIGAHGQQPPAGTDERQAQLQQLGEGCQGAGGHGVEALAERPVRGVLRTLCQNGQVEAKDRGRVGAERCLAVVGLEQCHPQVGPRDGEGNARHTAPRPDVEQGVRSVQMREQCQRVLDQLADVVALAVPDQARPGGQQVGVFVQERRTIHLVPIYEYRCDDCQDTFEVLTSFSNRDHTQTCPSCNGGHSHVQVSSFAALGAEPTGQDFATPAASTGGGCACGGACSCGGH